jgi:type I restriction enzyme S subunit
LGDLTECFEYGLNAPSTKYDGINKYIRITDIDDTTHLFSENNLTSPKIDLKIANHYILKENDILFARTGASVGKTYKYRIVDGKIYFAGFLIRARIKPEFDSEFVFQNTLTNEYVQFIQVTSQRSGQPGVNAQEYENFEFKVPKFLEQQKIGNFFRRLDNLITLHQCKSKGAYYDYYINSIQLIS